MRTLHRRLYLLLLRLHPAAFRTEFAHDMALDFEDALATYGLARLFLDATYSLARQWTTQLISPNVAPAQTSSHPLLAGSYAQILDEPLRPLELARGLLASATLLALCLFAFHANPGHIAHIGVVYAARSTPAQANPSGDSTSSSPSAFYPSAFASSAQTASSSPAATLTLGADGRPLAFDVVSIREDRSVSQAASSQHPTADGYHVKDMPLFGVIQDAYVPSSEGILSFRPGDVIGAPDWLLSAHYDIDAKVSDTDLPRWNDPAQQPAMRHAMLQAMLANRFKLTAHRETRIMPIFELTVSKNGPKFKPAGAATLDEIRQKHPDAQKLADGTIVVSGPNPGQQTFFGVTMPAFCTLLRNLAGRPVHDKTGLTGKYDISFQLELLPPQQEGDVPVPPDPYSLQIHTVVEDQLGLRLTSTKGPAEVLVIDHIDRPTAN